MHGKSQQEIESILNKVRIFSNDIAVEFGLDKCATLSIIRGKIVKTEGIYMTNNFIKTLDEEESYKYLGVLQADNIKHKEVKNKVSQEYIRRVGKILKSKLNGKISIQAINTWAVPVLRYIAGVINWTQGELEALDRNTRKNNDIKPCTTSTNENAVLKSIVTEGIIKEYPETKQEFKSQQMQRRVENWHSKALHGQFIRDTNDKINQEQTWLWLRKATLKKESEGLIMAAQDQALTTDAIKAKIDKSSRDKESYNKAYLLECSSKRYCHREQPLSLLPKGGPHCFKKKGKEGWTEEMITIQSIELGLTSSLWIDMS
ncbi:hypothetical protein JRQ81_013635 [Phrynocephalus forsythii]|uniref:Uncharacterized protein n=1 Tax=Phrynocephalus forsythii TaxID=171643 RepID=A0A9Q0Y287_9SAUR|nr:hypothetical protein JRQ81_013635 [Phrynocephalus forsythii]